jgi:transposase
MYHSIGIDISKSTLQVYIPIKDENISIPNTIKPVRSLYSKLKKYYKAEVNNVLFVFEPTGAYSSILKHFCADKQIKTFIVNPRQSSSFSKALDNRSKSDIIDSKMLSKMYIMAEEDDIKIPIINEAQENIKEQLSFYLLIQKQRNALSNHLDALSAKQDKNALTKKLSKEIARLKNQEKEIIEEILSIIHADATLSKGLKNITSIPGIGKLSAIALIHLFISYPKANRQQLSALCGLDPIETTSGTSLMRRSRISKKGNAVYRHILFMPVLISVRTNPYMKAFYERLKQNGKHTTQAQIAVMRKMILIAHFLFNSNQMFDAKLYENRISWNK